MALGWSRQSFLSDWAGLFARRQSVEVGRQYASVARNIDFFGSAVGKRLGSQLVNGWGTVANAGWANSPNGTGTVVDASGFQNGDTLTWRNPDTSNGSATISTVTYGSNTIVLAVPVGVLPQAGATVWTTRTVAPGGTVLTRMDGLFHAVFRDSTEYLLAAALDSGASPQAEKVWNLWGTPVNGGVSYVPALLTDVTQATVSTSVNGNWAGTTTGNLLTTETLVATDGTTNGGGTPNDLTPSIIQIRHTGVVIYEGTLSHISGTTITLTAAAASNPQNADQVYFFPHRTAGDTRFAQAGNFTHITSAAGINAVAGSAAATPSIGGVSSQPTVQRTPPLKFGVQPSVAINRHGIKPPTSVPTIGVLGAGTITATNITYRCKYRNVVTEQESEPGPASALVSPSAQNVPVTVTGSPDPQVDKIRFYRTPSGTTGTWYFVGEVANPGSGLTVTFTDTVAEPPSGPVMREFLDLTVPDTVTQLVYWPQAFRLVGIDAANQVVVVSDGPDPTIDPVTNTRGRLKLESFPADNVLFVNRDDGDKLVGLAAFYDAVLIFKGHSVWRLIGTPPDVVVQPVLFRDDLTAVGAFGPKAIAVDQDQMVFGGEDGMYGVSRSEGLATGFTSERLSRQIDDEWAPRIVAAQASKTHIIYTRQRRQLRVFMPVDANPTNEPNEEFVYQFDGTVEGQPHGWAEWSPPAIFTNRGDASPSKDTTASAVVRQAQGFPVAYYGTAVGLVLKSDQPLGHDAGNPFLVEYETTWFAPQGFGGNARGRALDTLWVVDAAAFAPVVANTIAPTLQLATDFAAAQTVVLAILAQVGPQNQRGIVFLLGQFHRLGFTEQDVASRYRLLGFAYLFQALPVTVADRAAFVQTVT